METTFQKLLEATKDDVLIQKYTRECQKFGTTGRTDLLAKRDIKTGEITVEGEEYTYEGKFTLKVRNAQNNEPTLSAYLQELLKEAYLYNCYASVRPVQGRIIVQYTHPKLLDPMQGAKLHRSIRNVVAKFRNELKGYISGTINQNK